MGLFSSDKTSADSGHINVVATVKARAGHEAAVKAMLAAAALKARAEDGCKGYHLLEEKKKPGSFYTYEEWVSEDALNVHLARAKPLLDKAADMLDGELTVIVLEHLF